MKKPSLSTSLIILGSILLFIFSVIFHLIDPRMIPFNDIIPAIILYSGWSMLGIGIAKRLYTIGKKKIKTELLIIIGIAIVVVIGVVIFQNYSFEPRVSVFPFFESEEAKLKFEIDTKTKQLGINNIMKAIDSEDLSYEEKLEYIKFRYEQDPLPSLNLRIKDLTRELEDGEQPTFTLIESGYAYPCTSPKLEVYLITGKRGLFNFGENEPIYEHQIIFPCPYFEKYSPILKYWTEQDFPLFPTCTTEGTYVIVGDDGTYRYALDEFYCNISVVD